MHSYKCMEAHQHTISCIPKRINSASHCNGSSVFLPAGNLLEALVLFCVHWRWCTSITPCSMKTGCLTPHILVAGRRMTTFTITQSPCASYHNRLLQSPRLSRVIQVIQPTSLAVSKRVERSVAANTRSVQPSTRRLHNALVCQ